MPAALPDVPWHLIQAAVCDLELSYEETATRYGIKSATIRQRAKRYKWPIPAVVRERVKEKLLERSQKQKIEVSRSLSQTEQKADIWLERQEEARVLGYEVGIKALKDAKKKPLSVETWKDLNYANDIVRKATGLDKQDQQQGNPFGWLIHMSKGNSFEQEGTASIVEIESNTMIADTSLDRPSRSS